jgi:hypothetical protein
VVLELQGGHSSPVWSIHDQGFFQSPQSPQSCDRHSCVLSFSPPGFSVRDEHMARPVQQWPNVTSHMCAFNHSTASEDARRQPG